MIKTAGLDPAGRHATARAARLVEHAHGVAGLVQDARGAQPGDAGPDDGAARSGPVRILRLFAAQGVFSLVSGLAGV